MNARIKLLIAEDDPALRSLLTQIVNDEDDLEPIGVASDAHEAAEIGAVFQPDVALLDVEIPKGGGVHAARQLRRRSPGKRLVALTSHEDGFTINAMLAAGVIGYIVKGAQSTRSWLRSGAPCR